MSSGFSDIVKQGYVKFKSKNLGQWRKRWIILCKTSSRGMCRIEKYEDERAAGSRHNGRSIPLTTVISLSRLSPSVKKHAVVIYMQESSDNVNFACDSELEIEEWYSRLEDIIHANPVSAIGALSNRTMDLVGGKDVYNVHLLPTPNMDTYGECLMEVTEDDMVLYDIDAPSKKLVSWPLVSLRRFGRDDTKFTFESGRFCDTGPGIFTLNTVQGEDIYQKVNSNTLIIAAAERVRRMDPNVTMFQNANSSRQRPLMNQTVSVDDSLPPKRGEFTRESKSVTDRAPLPLPRRQPTPPSGDRPPEPPPLRPTSTVSASPTLPNYSTPKKHPENNNNLRGLSKKERPLPSVPGQNGDGDTGDYDYLVKATSNSLAHNNTTPDDNNQTGSLHPATSTGPNSPSSQRGAASLPERELNNNVDAPEQVADEDVEYAEKYLEPGFRNFLSMRKKEADEKEYTET